jgi:hypothetical protein
MIIMTRRYGTMGVPPHRQHEDFGGRVRVPAAAPPPHRAANLRPAATSDNRPSATCPLPAGCTLCRCGRGSQKCGCVACESQPLLIMNSGCDRQPLPHALALQHHDWAVKPRGGGLCWNHRQCVGYRQKRRVPLAWVASSLAQNALLRCKQVRCQRKRHTVPAP